MTITCTELENLNNYTLIDVRSEKEFNESHIPGAINLPILNNLERETVGILFNREGKHNAIKKGFEFFMKKFDNFCSAIIQQKSPRVVVYCARGGIRSGITVDIFNDKQKILTMAKEANAKINYTEFEKKLHRLENVNAVKLLGGHKSYRQYLLTKFNEFNYHFTCIVLHGLTCVGKTDILHQLEREGYPVLDLEDLAQHRSSLFGAVGLHPRSQKMFEALLLEKLEQFKKQNARYVFVEGEARRIGNRIIPGNLFRRMNEGIHVFIEADMTERITRMLNDYFTSEENINHITSIIPQLKPFMGKKNVEELLELMRQKQYRKVAEILLQEHYDKRYLHGLRRKQFTYRLNRRDIGILKQLASPITTPPAQHPTLSSSSSND
jgi:tRNA 2-selenouridine synthase